MAQVSIQYALQRDVHKHDEKEIKKFLDVFPGVKSVRLHMDSELLCVDFDDTGISQEEIERVLCINGYPHSMLDKIIF